MDIHFYNNSVYIPFFWKETLFWPILRFVCVDLHGNIFFKMACHEHNFLQTTPSLPALMRSAAEIVHGSETRSRFLNPSSLIGNTLSALECHSRTIDCIFNNQAKRADGGQKGSPSVGHSSRLIVITSAHRLCVFQTKCPVQIFPQSIWLI